MAVALDGALRAMVPSNRLIRRQVDLYAGKAAEVLLEYKAGKRSQIGTLVSLIYPTGDIEYDYVESNHDLLKIHQIASDNNIVVQTLPLKPIIDKVSKAFDGSDRITSTQAHEEPKSVQGRGGVRVHPVRQQSKKDTGLRWDQKGLSILFEGEGYRAELTPQQLRHLADQARRLAEQIESSDHGPESHDQNGQAMSNTG